MNSLVSIFGTVVHGATHRRIWSVFMFPVLVALTCFDRPVVGAETGTSKEYKIKATYLYNFVNFVEWPPTAFAEAGAPLCIGILGRDDFGSFLDQLVQDETVKGHRLVIKRSKTVEDLKTCHILFISKSENPRLTQILANLGEASILTVGETAGFAENGGSINFFLRENRVLIEINPMAARRRGLKISSQLLSLVTIR